MKQNLLIIFFLLCLFGLKMTAQPLRQDVLAAMERANDYFIRKYPDVYIYGCGQYGTRAAELIRKWGFIVSGFVVSEK